MIDLLSCCRGGNGGKKESPGGKKRDLFVSVDDDMTNDDEDTSLPDLDAIASADTGTSGGNDNNNSSSASSTEGIFAFADEERGVTVMILNFIMVLLGLGRMDGQMSKRKAITPR